MKQTRIATEPELAPANANAPAERPNSLTRSVYQQLRSDLLSGHYRPGEKLRADELRQRFQIGSSPIREALNRLLAEGFVSLEEQ
jgi:DNA-binding GntR family transcriptional regulator